MITNPRQPKVVKPPIVTKKKNMTTSAQIFDLIDEEPYSYFASPIIEEHPPSTFVTSPQLQNRSPHTTSTSSTISNTLPSGTILGTETKMEIESIVQSIMVVISAKISPTSMLSLFLESIPLMVMGQIITPPLRTVVHTWSFPFHFPLSVPSHPAPTHTNPLIIEHSQHATSPQEHYEKFFASGHSL